MPRDTPPEPWSVCELLARRGHQRCHCNEEGFGTLSRQLGNDGGYRISRAEVSGLLDRWPAKASPRGHQGREKRHWLGSTPTQGPAITSIVSWRKGPDQKSFEPLNDSSVIYASRNGGR